MRVLVTGSRDWEGIQKEFQIQMILDTLLAFCTMIGTKLTIIHGACPSGADAAADRWARRRDSEGVSVQVYPADWETYGKAAGPRRNEVMVRGSRADLCLAFLRGGSTGTLHTVGLAREAGIPTYIIPWEETT